jgi:hypothetical protein
MKLRRFLESFLAHKARFNGPWGTSLACAIAVLASGSSKAEATSPGVSTEPHFSAVQLPIAFEQVVGHGESLSLFQARGQGFNLRLSPRGVSLFLQAADASREKQAIVAEVHTAFVGASPTVRAVGENALPGKVNLLTGSIASHWTHGIPTCQSVRYESIYPGIDLVFYGANRNLEYDFVIAPTADPSAVRWSIQGAHHAQLNHDGDLILETPAGILCQHKPVAYQIGEHGKCFIPAEFILDVPPVPPTGKNPTHNYQVAFKLGPYDHNRPLILDPTLSFATPIGGSGDDRAFGIAVDAAGFIYVTGQTTSPDFPGLATNPAAIKGSTDAFLTKFTPDGKSMVFSTVLGGSGSDKALNLAVNTNGMIILAGITGSSDFPVTNAAQSTFGGGDHDGFVACLDASGSNLVFASYVGGSADDDIACVACDSAGWIYVGGTTQSPNLPVVHALQGQLHGFSDAFLTRLDAKGKIDYFTYLGGSTGNDGILDLTTDNKQNVYVTGFTSSRDFPVTKGYQSIYLGSNEVFVAKFNANATALTAATFLGGAGDDVGRSIALDLDGNICLSGETSSAGFPVVNARFPHNAGQRDLFLAKLDPTCNVLIFSTYLGGSGDEVGAMSVDAAGNFHLAGFTSSRNFPTVSAFQPRFGGGTWDAFVATVKGDGSSLLFSTYLGGSGDDQVAAITTDVRGNIFVAGATSSANIPKVNPLQPLVRSGSYDAFVAKITPQSSTNIFAPSGPFPGSPAANATLPARRTTPPASAPNILDAIGSALPLFGKNLVGNGTAEFTRPGPATQASNDVPGWITDGSIRIAAYPQAGLALVPTNGGLSCFILADTAASGRASQTIDVRPAASFLDTGDARYAAGALLSGWQERTDAPSVVFSFLDASSNKLADVQLGPVATKDRSFFNRLMPRSISGSVPIGTQKIKVELSLNRDAKQSASAVADNIYLVLYRPPATLLQVTRSDDQVRLSWPAALEGYVIEASNTLPPSDHWALITNTPSAIDGQNTLVLKVSGPDQYYRLRKE